MLLAAGARRLFAGTIMAAAAALVLGVAPAGAAGSITITAHFGYADVVKTGVWMPLDVSLANTGPEVDGTLLVQGLVSLKPAIPWLSSYEQAIVVAPGSTKHFRFFVTAEQAGMGFVAEVLVGGRVVARQEASPTRSATTLIGVLSDDGTALDDLAAVHPGGLTASVVHLSLADLPDSAIPLRALDLIVFDQISTDGMTAAQRSAIAEYVDQGGSLLVGTGTSWQRTLSGLPVEILPMAISGLSTLTSSPELGLAQPLQVTTGTLKGSPWLSEGGVPLMVESRVGTGTVTLATYDPALLDTASSTEKHAVLRQLLARAVFSSPGGASAGNKVGGGPPVGVVGGFGGGGSLYQRSGSVSSILGGLPGLALPSFIATGLILLVYVIVIGPLNFLLLGALRRRVLSWITLPVISILATTASYGGAILTKGQSIQTNQVAVLHLSASSDRAYLETYAGVLAPTRGDYRVGLSQPALVSPISTYFGSSNSNRGDLQVSLPEGSILLAGMSAFTLRGFAAEGMVSGAPRLQGHLSEVNGQLTGSVSNLSDVTFRDAVVIAGDAYQKLGALTPGDTVAVSLTPQAVTPNGPSPLVTLYPNGSFGSPNGAATEAERQAQEEIQILSLLTDYTGFKGLPTGGKEPLLVAWTTRAWQDLTVNGVHPRGQALTAVALTLPLEHVGAGPLPAGVVAGRVVDVDAGAVPGPPGALLVQNGTITLDFTPALETGLQMASASLVASNPFLGSSPGSTSGSRGEAWDWTGSTWVDIGLQETGVTALPSGAVEPGTGRVRIRVTVGSTPFYSGGLFLTGTVR